MTARGDAVKAVLHHVGDGALLDRGGFVAHVNPAALAALAYGAEAELFWRPTADLVHPSDRARLAARMAGRPGEPFEVRLVRRTGELLPARALVVPTTLEAEPASLLLFREHAERRRMDKQLEFTDRMASIGTLAAGIAHEINSPLTYVIGNLDMLAEHIAAHRAQLPADAGRQLAELLAEAQEGALRMKSIIRELRQFARDPDNQRVADVDVRTVIESVGRMAMHELRHRARFVTELGDIPRVRANPGHLNQIFLNLIVNAAQAIEPGNVDGNQVRVTTGLDASGRVLVEVSDSGCGIPLDALERIFDPFYTTKDPGLGTGLGLSICHGLVSAMGGEITVDSIVGQGTTFRVMLPPAGSE